MPEPDQSVSPKTPGSFASLLASISSKLQNDPWDDSALADDVATITYEQALGKHRRVRPAESATKSLLNDSDHEAALAAATPAARPRKRQQNTGEKKPRAASITIRVTAEEQAQLHERAAAAQLSVSAYLRSCIFEAEALRAQVKEALSQIRSGTSPEEPAAKTSQREHSRTWRARLLPPWHRHRTSA